MARVQVRRWPIPIYNPRWLLIDPVRIDAIIGILAGIACAQFLASTTWRTLLVVFGLCFAAQVIRAIQRLARAIEALRATKYGTLKIVSGAIAIVGLLAAMVIFPPFAIAVVIFFLFLRIAVLFSRDDRVLLLVAAVLWLLSPLPSLLSLRFCWDGAVCSPTERFVPPLVSGFIGLFVALCCNKNGYRLARFPLALLESTTLVFGIVLAGLSVMRTAITVAASSPGIGNIQDSVHGSAGGRAIGSALGNPNAPGTKTIWVTGHMRTLPDGSTANNISSGNPGSVNPDQIYIGAYQRTLPDGILSNNLSASPSQATPGYLLNESSYQMIAPTSTRYNFSFTAGMASLIMSLDIALRDDVHRRQHRNKLTRILWGWIPAA